MNEYIVKYASSPIFSISVIIKYMNIEHSMMVILHWLISLTSLPNMPLKGIHKYQFIVNSTITHACKCYPFNA